MQGRQTINAIYLHRKKYTDRGSRKKKTGTSGHRHEVILTINNAE